MNKTSIEKLGSIVEHDKNLSEYTTFKLGGPCSEIIHCQSPFELEKAINYLNDLKREFILIGGGSNLVVSDSGLDCTVIRYVTKNKLIERASNDLIVAASVSLDELSLFACDQGLAGLVCTTGIPGTVGGAVVGNAGASGKQVGDVIKYVDVITLKGKKKRLSKEELGFTYRNSFLKETGDIVASVCFALEPCDSKSLLKDREEILIIRADKHPDINENPCAGSFFRNVEPTSSARRRQAAGWFLDEAGAYELKYGGAKVYPKHANIIIKGDDCISQDVYALSQRMQRLVKKKYDIDLIREVRFVGKFFGKPAEIKDIIW